MAGDDRIVVVGSGPAGSRAAETLYRAGCRNLTVISEAPESGGQIYRRQPNGFKRPPASLYGDDAAKAVRLHGTFDAFAGEIDYRPNTLVWNIFDGAVHTSDVSGTGRLEFDRLILSTGAMDRVIPIPGWTLPGVFTLGGSQIALKNQGLFHRSRRRLRRHRAIALSRRLPIRQGRRQCRGGARFRLLCRQDPRRGAHGPRTPHAAAWPCLPPLSVTQAHHAA
ncbi:FAD-dependent oxidoreductase [Mesorhizobium sp. UC22_110]|uniref:FAD-dependent oxidoreductase n=1 Tax=Mesorhizobium sp. UC22_110 TaxID=3374552 RepID=UPI0037569FD6